MKPENPEMRFSLSVYKILEVGTARKLAVQVESKEFHSCHMTGSKIGGEKRGPRRWRYLIDIVVLVAVTFLLDAVVGAFVSVPMNLEKGFILDAIGKILL